MDVHRAGIEIEAADPASSMLHYPYRSINAGASYVFLTGKLWPVGQSPRTPLAMARPRLSDEERRTLQVTLWVNRGERRIIEERAAAAGLSIPAYIRQRAVRDHLPIARPLRLGVAEYREVRQIGVNLNQIARALNQGADAPARTSRLLERLAGILERLLGTGAG